MYFALKNFYLTCAGNWISERDILHSAVWSHKFYVFKFHHKFLMDMMSTLYIKFLSSFFILSNRCTIKYSKNNVKIYIKINIKSVPTCFGLNNHHQGAWHLCFAKFIIIKIVSWNMLLKYSSAMWLHILFSPIGVCIVHGAKCLTLF
jgi:hypothetical protein